MALGALTQRALGEAPPGDRRLQLGLDPGASAPGLADALLGALELEAARTPGVAGELEACFEDLTLQPLMQLGSFRLALERTQAASRLSLDVQGAIEVLLRALELQLRPAPALAVLAEPGRLLDQQPPVARLGGHDRIDAPL